MKGKAIVVCLLLANYALSQGISNLWLLGAYSWAGVPFGGINLNFLSGSLSISSEYRVMNFSSTNGILCDKNGNLLFSSNGIFIANASNDTMLNGDSLNRNSFTAARDSFGLNVPQANLVIPIPGDTDKYYLFHETCDDYGNTFCSLNLYFSIIDMTLDSNRGGVIQKNSVLLHDSLVLGRLTSCKHANGRDWWLIAHQNQTNCYYKYLVTPYGITGPNLQNIGSNRDMNYGQVAFSPDGERFASYDPLNDLDLLSFDRCSGVFYNLIHVSINDSNNYSGGGVAFSPNSKVLYVSSLNYIYQFDLTSSNIAASQTTIGIYDGYYSPQYPFATTFYLSQLAPDGKIYINSGNSVMDIHVINNPDSLNLSCDLCQHCVHLPSYNYATIPNYPNYFLDAQGGTICDSLGYPNSIKILETGILKFYPNPVINSEIFLQYNVIREYASVSIFNSNAQMVLHLSLPQWSTNAHLRLPELASGVYLIRLESEQYILENRFIIDNN